MFSSRSRAASGQEVTGAVLPRRQILVVDDRPDAVDAAALLLETLGQAVLRAYDGKSALQLASLYGPEIVLLDLDMPGMSGLEVVRHLRNLPRMRAARIVAYTGFGRPEYRATVATAGFDDVVVKPATLERLIEVIGSLRAPAD